MDEERGSVGSISVMEPMAPPMAPGLGPPGQLPPPPPHTSPVITGSWWRPAVVGGLVGAMVATSVSLVAVTLTDDDSARTVIQPTAPPASPVAGEPAQGLDVGAVLD